MNGAGLDAYRAVVGSGEIRDIRRVARFLQGRKIQHINSTREGGGVAEILSRLIPLMQEVGLEVDWTILDGSPDFFQVTKDFHNALHGEHVELSNRMIEIYQETTARNREKLDGDADVVVLHDPQPLGLASLNHDSYPRKVWRCHIDVSQADPSIWRFLQGHVSECHSAIYHLAEYARNLPVNEFIVPPAIDPLSEKNRDMPEEEIESILSDFGIDRDRPIVAQISRFDRLKDPAGVIRAFRLARRYVDCQLVVAGGGAVDDPEAAEVLTEVEELRNNDPDIFVLNLPPNPRAINALQRGADVIVQKSLREGFGLVVTEAMWKSKPVIGGNVGGIRRQIMDGTTGYLVNTIEGLSWRMRELLGDPEKARKMGKLGKEHVRQNFLLPELLKNYLLIFLSLDHEYEHLVELN